MRYLLIVILSIAFPALAQVPVDNFEVENSLKLDYTTIGSLVRINGSKLLVDTTLVSGDIPSLPANKIPLATSSADGYLSLTDWSTFNSKYNIPSQTGNAGKFLSTDGSVTSWTTVSGTGTVTSVASANGSIDITNPTTTPDLAIHFPLTADTGTAGAPSIRFDSDTGMFSTGDGILSFSTNSIQQLQFATGGSGTNTFLNSLTAPDFIYPVKTAHTFLAGPTTGSPAIPDFRALTTGDVPNSAIPYPLFAPQNVTYLGTGYCFDSDTCMDSSGDGEMFFSANSQLHLHISQNYIESFGGWTHNGDFTITGNIAAANYPPAGSANTFAGYSNTGVLGSVLGWSWDDVTGGARAYNLIDFTSSATMHNFETAWEIPADTSGVATSFHIDSHWDRNNSGFDVTGGSWDGLDINHNLEGSSHIPQIKGINLFSNLGNNGGSTDDYNGMGIFLNVPAGATTQNATGLAIDFDSGGSGTLTNNLTLVNLSSRGAIDGNYFVQSYNNNNTGDVGGDYRFMQYGNDGDVGNNAAGVIFFHSGTLAKAFTGVGTYVSSPDVGDGSSYIVGNDVNFNNGTIHGGITGYSFNNNDPQTNSGTLVGFYGNNTNTSSGYRAIGFSWYDGSNMSEEKRGIQLNLQGNARTGTGMDLSMSGAYTDDVHGLRINMDSVTTASASNHVSALEVSGGTINLRGRSTPFSGGNVEITNGMFADNTIEAGFPLTGTDQIIQLQQSNLSVHDDISTGPFGLDTNMNGMVSQIMVDSGKTVPVLRSLLLGTSTPAGSGGTITSHTVLTLIGLPSFGGSVNNPTRIAVEDAPGLLGQDFCNGATDCWIFKANDSNSENYLPRLAVNTSSKKVSSPEVGVDIHDKVLSITQTTPPTATPDANAGTGATCTVTGSDSSGTIELTTGAALWALGSQCAIGFNLSHAVAPNCTFSSKSDNAAVAVTNTYLPDASTSGFTINFVVPDITTTVYKWGYHCDF